MQTVAAAFTLQDFRRRASDRALPLVGAAQELARPALRGDHDADGGAIGQLPGENFRQAAVLVPIVAREEVTVLLTRRAAHLSAHAGQIAFPGGKPSPEDADLVETALREAEEEVGLARRFVEPIARLDLYHTGTGFRILPILGVVTPGFTLVADETEVDDIFEVPLRFLMTVANHQRHSIEWQGRQRQFYAMPFEDRYIWGATAGILRVMYERLYAE
jgi:8-oxo-dGTP pyrophosphatase MutT (NUDIX family)